jgi:hypothetical protein
MWLGSAKTAIGRAEIVIFSCFLTAPLGARVGVSNNPVPRFIVANLVGLCHKRNLIARLIKGCRGDVLPVVSLTK